MLPAACAYKHQFDLVLRLHRERYSLLVAAIRAQDIWTSCERRVLDALRIDFDLFSAHGEVSPVNAVVHLVAFLGAYIVVANLADELEVASLSLSPVRLGIQHVVAVGAEAHPLELLLFAGSALTQLLLRAYHISDLEEIYLINYRNLRLLHILTP